MILDTAPYTIVQTSDGLEVRNSDDQTIAMIEIRAMEWRDDELAESGMSKIPEAERIALHAELARMIESMPALFTTTRRFIRNLHATMAKVQPGPHPRADSLAGIIETIEGHPKQG
jgi:hypothetical protein